MLDHSCFRIADFEQTPTFPSPPPILADTFSKAVTWLSPGGGAPLGRDKSMFYGGSSPENRIFDLQDTFAGNNKLITYGKSLEGFKKPEWTDFDEKASGFDKTQLDDIFVRLTSAAFARASSG